jgi:hypothetical protein
MLSQTVMGLLFGFVEANLKNLIKHEVREEINKKVDNEERAK